MTLDDAGRARSATQESDLPPAAVEAEALVAERRRWTPARIAVWVGVGLLGGLSWVMVAIVRGETVNAMWFVFAAVCTYFIAYRFYSTSSRKDAEAGTTGATPAEYNENGQDYMPTDRRVLFGHHFAAIAGAGPLVGPVLAAQMGYLPGTIWIIVGVVLAGAVQDYLVLFFSMRRGGRSLGQMAREQLGRVGGIAAIDRHARHHDHHRGDPRPGRGQRPRREPVGRLLGLDDHPDRPVHGRVPAVPAAGEGRRGLGHRVRAADGLHHRRRLGRRDRVGRRCSPWTARRSPGDHRLRLRRRRAAGVAAARPARLPLDVHEGRHDRHARRRRSSSSARHQRAAV